MARLPRDLLADVPQHTIQQGNNRQAVFFADVDYATYDTTGIPDVIRTAGNCLLPGGCLAMVGVPPENTDMPADLLGMLMRGITARYVIEGDADPQTFIPQMLEWYLAGRFPFDRLIREFPFEQINEAAAAADAGEVIKPVLVFDH